jgi:Flp pilus assembly protein TadG
MTLPRFRCWMEPGNDRRGSVLIEFAITLPVMLLLFLGGYQLCDAITCKRKVMIAARAVADMTSQYTLITPSQVDTILGASIQILAPYPVSAAKIRVSQITVNGSGAPAISWSRGYNNTAYVAGSAFNLPTTMRTANTSYIFAEITYTYQPVTVLLFGPLAYNQSLYMLPRGSSSVVLKP